MGGTAVADGDRAAARPRRSRRGRVGWGVPRLCETREKAHSPYISSYMYI